MSESACSELPGFQIFDQAPTALSCSRLSADGQAGPTHWNRAWLSAFGYAAADVQGLNGRDFQLWHDPQELVERLLFGLTTSRHQRALLEIFDRQRQLRHVEVAGQLMEQRDQRYLILSYQDRTAQLAQTDKLHEYRTMVLTSNDGMFLAENKCIVECNEAAERFFQLPRNKLLQADPLKLAPLEPGSCPDMERARTAFSLASQGAAQSFKWEHTLPNGKWFCADIVLTPVHNLHTNEPQRFVGVIRNVTEARRTARNLAINAERFRKLFELAPVPLMLTTHDGRISSVNRQFERIFGYEASELLTLSQWRRLAYPDPNVREQLRERTRQLNIELDQAKGTVLLMEVTAQRKDGQSRVMQASIGRLENETLTAYLDITDIRQAHHALQSLNAELE
jgi:PAS domain S-box-containing protein